MLYEPQHNMFRGANKIICGVDITRLWDVGTEFFINECLTNIFALSELKKTTCSSPFVEGNKFFKFSVYKFDVWCTKHGIYFFSVFCNSHRRVTYSCCKKLSYNQ